MTTALQVQAAYAAHRRARLGQTAMILLAIIVATLISATLGEVDLVRLWDRSDRLFNYFGRMVSDLAWETLAQDLAKWYRRGGVWVRELGVTVLIAIYATFFGMLFAVLGAFVAARPLAPAPWACWAMRRVFEFARTVPELVFAVLFVFSFGIGPLAGVLAIGLHSMGALGKLYSEVAESADPDPVRGIRATGASWPQIMRYGALPQVAPAFLSYGLLRFEINVPSWTSDNATRAASRALLKLIAGYPPSVIRLRLPFSRVSNTHDKAPLVATRMPKPGWDAS
jgi:phosphonate transport system permease protein